MPQISPVNALPKGHMKPFWPLAIIFVVAAVAAGLIYWFQFSLNMDYDLQSISFSVQRRGTPAKTKVPPVKSKTITPYTTPATTK